MDATCLFLCLLATGKACATQPYIPGAFDLLLGRRPSTSIVIAVSPLIALMKDQVAAMSAKGLAIGCVTQESSDEEKARVKSGEFQLVFF